MIAELNLGMDSSQLLEALDKRAQQILPDKPINPCKSLPGREVLDNMDESCNPYNKAQRHAAEATAKKTSRIFLRMVYFMRKEQGYWGCTIVGFFKGIKFVFARWWYGNMAAKALRGYFEMLKTDLQDPDQKSLLKKTLGRLKKDLTKDILVRMASKVKLKGTRVDDVVTEANNPVKIVSEVWDFFNSNYDDSLVLLDMDDYMAKYSNQQVVDALRRVAREINPAGKIALGTLSRRAPQDELIMALRLPLPGQNLKGWKLFEHGSVVNDVRPDSAGNDARILCVSRNYVNGTNPENAHMQFPRMAKIVEMMNRPSLDASGVNQTPISDTDKTQRAELFNFSMVDVFNGEFGEDKLPPMIEPERFIPGRAMGFVQGLLADSEAGDGKRGILAEVQLIFASELNYCDMSYKDLLAKMDNLALDEELQKFFMLLWSYNNLTMTPAKGKSNELQQLMSMYASLNESGDDKIFVKVFNKLIFSPVDRQVWPNADKVYPEYASGGPEGHSVLMQYLQDGTEDMATLQKRPQLKVWWASARDFLLAHVYEQSKDLCEGQLEGISSNCDKALQVLACMWQDYAQSGCDRSARPRKLVVCGDDSHVILENTWKILQAVQKFAPELIPPHVKNIRFSQYDFFGENVNDFDVVRGYIRGVDCSDFSPVRTAFAEVVSAKGGVLDIIEKGVSFIEKYGRAGWVSEHLHQAKIKVSSDHQYREYVSCRRALRNDDDKAMILNPGEKNEYYHPGHVKRLAFEWSDAVVHPYISESKALHNVNPATSDFRSA